MRRAQTHPAGIVTVLRTLERCPSRKGHSLTARSIGSADARHRARFPCDDPYPRFPRLPAPSGVRQFPTSLAARRRGTSLAYRGHPSLRRGPASTLPTPPDFRRPPTHDDSVICPKCEFETAEMGDLRYRSDPLAGRGGFRGPSCLLIYGFPRPLGRAPNTLHRAGTRLRMAVGLRGEAIL